MVWRVLFGGEAESAVADTFATTSKTVKKWVDRYQADGLDRENLLRLHS